jgi:hypothetical protein
VDGLHLSGDGNAAVFDAIMDVLTSQLPQILPSALPDHYPAWDNVDFAHPELTFPQLTLTPQ